MRSMLQALLIAGIHMNSLLLPICFCLVGLWGFWRSLGFILSILTTEGDSQNTGKQSRCIILTQFFNFYLAYQST